jgi:hypothetical protein
MAALGAQVMSMSGEVIVTSLKTIKTSGSVCFQLQLREPGPPSLNVFLARHCSPRGCHLSSQNSELDRTFRQRPECKGYCQVA